MKGVAAGPDSPCANGLHSGVIRSCAAVPEDCCMGLQAAASLQRTYAVYPPSTSPPVQLLPDANLLARFAFIAFQCWFWVNEWTE